MDNQYHGSWCTHLLEQAITTGTIMATAYNTVDIQGHHLIKYNLKERCSFYFTDKENCKKYGHLVQQRYRSMYVSITKTVKAFGFVARFKSNLPANATHYPNAEQMYHGCWNVAAHCEWVR